MQQRRAGSRTVSTTAGRRVADAQLIVLVDDLTEGTATLLAAAVQEHGRGRLLRTQAGGSFGMGQVFDLPEGTGLRIKIGRVTTGKGNSLEQAGSRPDIAVDMTVGYFDRGIDVQLQEAVQRLLAGR